MFLFYIQNLGITDLKNGRMHKILHLCVDSVISLCKVVMIMCLRCSVFCVLIFLKVEMSWDRDCILNKMSNVEISRF